MTSGIYKLTFSSGKYYIGKSLDVEARWKQHYHKFSTGKAARPMQVEFSRCGPPKTEVIFYCHKDHIDLMEDWLIDQLKGPDMLNTTYPKVDRSQEVAELIRHSQDLLQQSTWEHLQLIHKTKAESILSEDKVREARALVQQYKDSGYIIDDDYQELLDTANDLHYKLTDANLELKRLKNLSWFDRLFNYNVNV